ncbi:Fc.00g038810.m01.CDS01 [Cosmosporella sp. VM-42]
MTIDEKATISEKSRPLRIVIIGAGIGGLVLAQLLQNNPKFSVTVYERGPKDEQASSLTGFRILLSKEMLAALRKGLPSSVTTLLEKAVGIQPPGGQSIALLDQKGGVKLGLTPKDFRDASSVSRWKLRCALLEGLDEVIQWQTEFQSYEKLGNGIRVSFKDGTTTQCDLLVGADGAGSKVRKQLLPQSTRDSLGITVLYFKMPLTRETKVMMPFGTGCMVMAPRSSMVVSYYQDKGEPYGPYEIASIDPEGSYLMCGLGCYTEDYVRHGKHPDDMKPEELKDFWLARTGSWHPLFRSLIAIVVPETVYVSNVKTQHKLKAWKSENVAILGDAAHSMTPYLGKGATSAIADALSLAEHLDQLSSGDVQGLSKLLDDYTAVMLKSGFGMAKKSKVVHDLVFMGSTPFKAHCRNALLRTLSVLIGSKTSPSSSVA